MRRLLVAVAAVEVAADADMVGVAGQFADVDDVVDEIVERDDLGLRLALDPPRVDHPCVEGSADDTATGDDGRNLLVGELAAARDQGAAVVVARQHGA